MASCALRRESRPPIFGAISVGLAAKAARRYSAQSPSAPPDGTKYIIKPSISLHFTAPFLYDSRKNHPQTPVNTTSPTSSAIRRFHLNLGIHPSALHSFRLVEVRKSLSAILKEKFLKVTPFRFSMQTAMSKPNCFGAKKVALSRQRLVGTLMTSKRLPEIP